jgi:flavodoxin, long chain
MKKTGVFYGSSSGTTEDIAQRIAAKLGVDSSDVFDVAKVDGNVLASYEALLLGSSTWGAGDLQDDWEDFIKIVEGADLSGKIVAVFGPGDSASFSDTFCDAIGTIYNAAKGAGATMVGAVSTEGYSFDDSTAVIDGVFVGLPIDELNEDDQTDARIDAWVEQLKSAL